VTDPLASPRLTALRTALADGDGAAVERFWAEVEAQGTPLVEPAPPPAGPDESDPLAAPGAAPAGQVLVTFLWRGGAATENVVVVGPLGHREPADGRMARLPGTDVWYRTERLHAAARTVYRLAENDSLAPLPAFGRDPRRFLEPFSAVCNHFRPRRHLLSANQYRQIRDERFAQWREVVALAPAV
jgi:enterochelin esterase family protein